MTAIGKIVGALADSPGNVLGQVNQELALPVANVASTCNQLRMELAATDAEVLKTPVHFDKEVAGFDSRDGAIPESARRAVRRGRTAAGQADARRAGGGAEQSRHTDSAAAGSALRVIARVIPKAVVEIVSDGKVVGAFARGCGAGVLTPPDGASAGRPMRRHRAIGFQNPSRASSDCSICTPFAPPAVSRLTMLLGLSPSSVVRSDRRRAPRSRSRASAFFNRRDDLLA